jgi:hypothetical protein
METVVEEQSNNSNNSFISCSGLGLKCNVCTLAKKCCKKYKRGKKPCKSCPKH